MHILVRPSTLEKAAGNLRFPQNPSRERFPQVIQNPSTQKTRAMASKSEVAIGCVKAWVDAVSSLSVESVVALYHETEGTLLGTVDVDDNAVRCGKERVKEYFTHFLAKDAVEPNFPEMKGTREEDRECACVTR